VIEFSHWMEVVYHYQESQLLGVEFLRILAQKHVYANARPPFFSLTFLYVDAILSALPAKKFAIIFDFLYKHL